VIWRPKDKAKRSKAWHRWFAWYPVYIDCAGVWVWLETIERTYLDSDEYGPNYSVRLLRKTQHLDERLNDHG